MLNKREKNDFLKQLRAQVHEYKNLRNADIKTISEFDYRRLNEDWKAVGNDIRTSIKGLNEQIEQDGR